MWSTGASFEVKSSLTRARLGQPPGADQSRCPRSSSADILVPVFGTMLDDDIVGTAGRLAAAEEDEHRLKMPQGFAGSKERTGRPRSPVMHDDQGAAPASRGRRAPRGREEGGADPRAGGVRWGRSTRTIQGQEAQRGRGPRPSGRGSSQVARELRGRGDRHGRRAPHRRPVAARSSAASAARSPPEVGAATEYVLRKSPCRVLSDRASRKCCRGARRGGGERRQAIGPRWPGAMMPKRVAPRAE